MKKLKENEEGHLHSYVKINPPFMGGDDYVHCRICGFAISIQQARCWANDLLEQNFNGDVTTVKREDIVRNWDDYQKREMV